MRLCPLGQPAINMNGNHTVFFNPRTADAVRAVSHKVWATMKAIALCVILAACRLCFGADDTNVVIMSEWSKPVSLRNDHLHDESIRARMLILQGVEPAY